MPNILEVKCLSKTYRGSGKSVRALEGISLHVAGGEMVMIRGPSGSGKSTLLLCCGGLLAPDEGEIAVNGQNPYLLGSSPRAAFRASAVGFVFQQFHLVSYLSVLDNVLTANVSGEDSRVRDRAAQLLSHFGLGERVRHRPGELSVGERQRTALARAMLNNPALILADEPTGNLDPRNSGVIMTALREYADGGKAVLVVTHDPGATNLAHRVLHLDSGQMG